jgi:hypothetical protein
LDYDAVTLRLKRSNGARVAVRGKGHIYVALSGFWDDTLILDAQTTIDDDVISMAIEPIRDKSKHPSGNPDRNSMAFRLLRVTFEDLGRLECVAGNFEVELLGRVSTQR